MENNPERQQRTETPTGTAPLCYGGGSWNIYSCAINNHCAEKQFSASNLPGIKGTKTIAANNCKQIK